MPDVKRPGDTVWIPACDHLLGFERDAGVAHAIAYTTDLGADLQAVCGAKVTSFGHWVTPARANMIIAWPPRASDWAEVMEGPRCKKCFELTGKPRPNAMFDGVLRGRRESAMEPVRPHDIERLLLDMFGRVETSRDGAYTFPFDSTRVFIQPLVKGGASITHVYAVTNVDVSASDELYEFIALNADSFLFGHLGVIRRGNVVDVVLSHRLLTDALTPPELELVVTAVAATANQADDLIQRRFGGRRYRDLAEGVPPGDPPSSPAPTGGYL
jgi:hypothetical protein